MTEEMGSMGVDVRRSLRRRRGEPIFTAPNQKERELLEVVGMAPDRFRVATRRPVTVAFGRRAYLPALAGGLIVLGSTLRDGFTTALAAAIIGGLATGLTLAAHEAGHLLAARRARDVEPRMLALFAGGGVSIVEGRFSDPRSAATFSAGGPIASFLVTGVLLAAGLLLPSGAYATAFLIPAVLSLMLAVVNLLPIAPMDGYMLFRAWMWAELGDRAEAERRAIDWSRSLIAYALLLAVVAYQWNHIAGLVALVFCASFVIQHHRVVAKQAERKRQASA
jgi:Zn-dependent protease